MGAFQENVGGSSVVCRLRRACRPLAGRAAVLGCLETGGSASSSLTVLYVGVNQEGFRKKKKKEKPSRHHPSLLFLVSPVWTL